MTTDFSDKHDWKVLIPKLVTLVGMVIDGNDIQSEKALSPIEITLVGIITDVSEAH
jgi:hypothetical protein